MKQRRNSSLLPDSSISPWLLWPRGASSSQSDFQSGHMPGLRARFPVEGLWEARAGERQRIVFLLHLHVSLPLFLRPFPSLKKLNKIFLKNWCQYFTDSRRRELRITFAINYSQSEVTRIYHILPCIMPLFAQIFEGKIRMHIIHAYDEYIPWV